MKKLSVIAIALLIVLSFSSTAFAGGSSYNPYYYYGYIKGRSITSSSSTAYLRVQAQLRYKAAYGEVIASTSSASVWGTNVSATASKYYGHKTGLYFRTFGEHWINAWHGHSTSNYVLI